MAEVANESAEAMDVKIELARIEMKGKEASVTSECQWIRGLGHILKLIFLF